jgi:hypothetical protein
MLGVRSLLPRLNVLSSCPSSISSNLSNSLIRRIAPVQCIITTRDFGTKHKKIVHRISTPPNDLFPPVPPAPPGVFHHVKRGFPAKVNPNEKILNLRKSNVAQSPLKMRFLVMLVRNRWMPDAIAQMKFSPKHRAVEVGKMLRVSYFFVCL